MADKLIIKGAAVYAEKEIYQPGYIQMEDGKITQLGRMEGLSGRDLADFRIIEAKKDEAAVPGFIDTHIHGAGGADTMDSTAEALDTIARTVIKEGTTGFLATTMTQSKEAIEAALVNAGKYAASGPKPKQAQVLGIHLEGPFLCTAKAGAQPEQYIIPSDVELFKKWQQAAGSQIRIVTLAPEQEGGLALTSYLKKEGILASVGHSNATYQEVEQAIEAGASQVTHLFNQMRGFHHREPGIVGAAYHKEELSAELIADGVHVVKEALAISFRQKGKDSLVLITDSLRAKGMPEGVYDLGGQEINVKDGKAMLPDGTLAGSVLTMNKAVKNMLAFTDAVLADAVCMASANPAKRLGIFDKKGSLAVGKDADVVLLDKNMDVKITICNGEIAFQQEEEGK